MFSWFWLTEHLIEIILLKFYHLGFTIITRLFSSIRELVELLPSNFTIERDLRTIHVKESRERYSTPTIASRSTVS